MKTLLTPCLIGAALTLAACGNPNDATVDESAMNALPDEQTTDPDTMSTFEGAGDTTSAAGAGATTGAMDGGRAGDDGLPSHDAARGGAEDAIDSPETGGAAGDGGPPGGPQS